ncbi:MAG TPA: hypothetical protein VIA08_01470 [Nitrososphaeraceae archaeon]|jgi:hypothetical protein
MVSIKNTGLVLVLVVLATTSLALLTPYEIVNSISLQTGNTSPSDSLSKFDFDDDEFTGDAVPVLVNADTS